MMNGQPILGPKHAGMRVSASGVDEHELSAEQIGYHDVDIHDRIESADGRFKVKVVGVNRSERMVDFTSHGEHMVSGEKMFKMNARLMMSMGARYFTHNPWVHPSPDASAGVGGATRCCVSESDLKNKE